MKPESVRISPALKARVLGCGDEFSAALRALLLLGLAAIDADLSNVADVDLASVRDELGQLAMHPALDETLRRRLRAVYDARHTNVIHQREPVREVERGPEQSDPWDIGIEV